MLGSNEIDIINISDSYGTYMDVYVSEKEDEEKPLQDIQPMNGLKVSVGAEKADGMAITFTTYENQPTRLLVKGFHASTLMMINCFCGMVDRRKAFTPYFQPRPFSEILTIANFRHAASRV